MHLMFKSKTLVLHFSKVVASLQDHNLISVDSLSVGNVVDILVGLHPLAINDKCYNLNIPVSLTHIIVILCTCMYALCCACMV